MSRQALINDVISMRLHGYTYRSIQDVTGLSLSQINRIWKGYKREIGALPKWRNGKRKNSKTKREKGDLN